MSLEVVKEVRGKYPTPLGKRHGDFLEEVAVRLSLGLVAKSWGTFVETRDGVGVSQDCLMAHGGLHWDVLGDGEGAATPKFDLVVHEGTEDPIVLPPSRYVAPRNRQDAPGGPIAPPPVDPVVPDPIVPCKGCQELEHKLTELAVAVEQAFLSLRDRLDAVEKLELETNRVWGHSHRISIKAALSNG
jgi:hypothetical protein